MTRAISLFLSLSRLRAACLGTGLLLGVANTHAQDAIMSAPQEPVTAPMLRQATPADQSRPPSPPETPLKYGPFSFRPFLLYRYLNAEGLPVGRRRVASEIQTFAPGLALDIGAHWSLDYSPTWTWYTARAFNDTVDQSARFSGAAEIADWGLQFTENFGISSPTLAETARQTKQRTWLTSLGAARNFGSVAGIELNASLNERYGDLFPDTRNWSTQDWLTVHFSPQFDIGFGPGAGYVDIGHAPDMTYERYLGRLNWQPTDKLTFGVNGGIEYRRSRSSSGKEIKSPILDASLAYQPFSTTKLGLSYSKSVDSSYFRDQVTKSSDFRVSLDQRLLEHFFLRTSWGRRKSSYDAVTTTVVLVPPPDAPEGSESQTLIFSRPGRSDRVDLFNVRLTVQFLKRLTFAAVFQHSQNHSTEPGFSYSSKQYGVELSCKY